MPRLSLLRTSSIRARMTAAFTFALALLLVSGIALSLIQARRTAEKRAGDLLNLAAERADFELHEPDNRAKTTLAIIREEQGELAAGDLALLMLDEKGREMWRSRDDAPHWPLSEEDEANWRVRSIKARKHNLVLALPWAETEAQLRESALKLTALGVLLLIASAVGAWMLVGHTLKPINMLSHQVQNATPKHLQVRLNAPSPDVEVVHLVDTLNGLLERLQQESSVRGRFYAAASHELRTPLQALMGELDVILSRPRERDDYREALEEVQLQALRLMALVQELLQLNQLQMAPALPPISPVNVAEMVERQLQLLGKSAADRHLQIETLLIDANVVMPPGHGEMLCRNLLENAVNYTREGGHVRVKVEQHNTGTHLEVWNEADMAPDTDLSLWFEPFFRPDAARQSHTGGNGLGLAICKTICDANEWPIELRQREDGVEVLVEFHQPTEINLRSYLADPSK